MDRTDPTGAGDGSAQTALHGGRQARGIDFALELTTHPSGMREEDVLTLRGHGFDDTAISDIVQTTALFNYYDRLADGLGIEPEPDWETREF